VSGNLNSVGSDTMNNLLTYWAEGFAKSHPTVKVQIEGKGSSTAPTALLAGTAQLGPMSRAMKGTEIDQFEKKYGYKPTQIRTSVDALGVFVNKDNPIKCSHAGTGDAIFSGRDASSRRTWALGQLGLTGIGPNGRSAYSAATHAGTYGFFKEHILKNSDTRMR
jgi:phosphate transport system substrate-binding protein